MADISDVAKALQALVQGVRNTEFPTGIVLYGWPGSAEIAGAQRAPLVTVWQRAGHVRNSTRYPVRELYAPEVAPTLTVSRSGDVATFAGTCSPDQIAGVQVGTTAWAVRCGANDTPTTIAAALAALSGGSATGPAVTLAGMVNARTGRDRTAYRITRQQEVGFSVIVWTPDPIVRDQVASAIDAVLSDVEFLSLGDCISGRLTWAGSVSIDRAQNSDLYSRQLHYNVDFPTTRAFKRTPVLFPGATLAPGNVREGALHP